MIDRGTARSVIPIVVALACGFALPTSATAQDEAPRGPRPTVSRNAPPSPNATVNLINLLVKQGVLDEAQAAALVKQADEEAYVARQAAREATVKADGAKTTADTALDATSPKGTKRITYVPEVVKKQIREDLRREVMAQAKSEGWAAPGKFPEWVSRIRFMGDLRVRYEGDFFPKGNNPYTAVNYNAINTGSPYNTASTGTGSVLWPTYNVDQDRDRARLRARLGMEADLFDGFTAGIRIATGDNNAPVSFNQTLGSSGGNFSKYAIWLDRAFINYRPWDDLSFYAGRFDNPFFHPTDLVYHRDLGFDGIAAKAKYEIAPGITPFLVAGVFPLYNTDFNVGNGIDYATGTVGKFPSHDKWMVGAQTGSDFRVTSDIDLKLGVAYYDFMNVRGHLSSPCYVYNAADLCDTDLTRPSFAQKGNAYMALRNIIPTADNSYGKALQYQYFGLASAFRDVVLSGRLDFGHFHPVHVVLDGEYVQNVAWDRADIAAKVNANPIWATNAVAPCPTGQTACGQIYEGGNVGWLMRMTVGYKQLKEFGDWNFHVGYKYLESDAVIDAFADSDFGLGGTNLKGYFVGANLALGQNVWASARWMSANQVAGAPYAVDIIQVDLNARF